MKSKELHRKIKLLKDTILPIYKDSPYMSHIWVTRHCNIRCKFCYIKDFSSPDPSLEEIDKRLDKIKELGCRLTVIMGGEPTLRKDLTEIVKKCTDKDIISYLVTNGTLLNRRMADKLGAAGLDVISMSLDTLTPARNKLVSYGKYAFKPENKLKILKYLHDTYGVLSFVAICLTKQNFDEVIPLIRLCEKFDLPVTLTAMADPQKVAGVRDKRWKAEKNASLFRTEPDLKRLAEKIKQLDQMKRDGCRIIEPYAYFKRVEDSLNNKENPCKAGLKFFDINVDGKIMLCVMSKPLDIHYSQLTKSNFVKTLKPYRDRQLKSSCQGCLLAAYFDTSYYGNHIIDFLKVFEKTWDYKE
jgi:MoaA/NifB/PqqE/SkfB family radical SAM enzyme